MFNFLSAIFHKVAVLATSVLVAVGLVSAPVAPVSVAEPAVNEAATAILVDQAVKPEPAPEKPAVVKKAAPKPAPAPAPVVSIVPPPAPVVIPTASKTQKLTLPNGAVVEIDASGNVIQAGGVPQPVPAPVPSPASANAPAPLPAGFFRLPSGLIVNEAGNVVNP